MKFSHGIFVLFIAFCANLFVLGLEATPAAVPADAVPCSEMTSCNACNNRTFCHWCTDGECHAIGSIHGCVYGVTCYSNEQCERNEPEYRGYAAPSVAVLLGVCLVGGTAIFCGMATISIAREYANQTAISRPREESSTTIPVTSSTRCGSNNEYQMLYGDNRCGVNESDMSSHMEVAAAGASTASSSVTPRAKGAAVVPPAAYTQLAPEPSPLARKILTLTRLVCGLGIAGVLLTCATVIAFAPHVPGVNVCNTEFDWGSIINSVRSLGPEVDFQLLVSIYNPNLLDAKIESGTALLHHKHQKVGTIVFTPTVIPGGYVTDMLLPISIEADAKEEVKLGIDYETGSLAFLMDATVSASVMFHGLKTYPFSFSINNYYIKVSTAVGYDRSLCNCSQMMQGKRPADEGGEVKELEHSQALPEHEEQEITRPLDERGPVNDSGP